MSRDKVRDGDLRDSPENISQLMFLAPDDLSA